MVAQDLLPTEHQGTSLDKRLGLVLWSRREAVLLMTETLGGPLTRPVAQRKTPPPQAPRTFLLRRSPPDVGVSASSSYAHV